jgi:hypothetical protein
MSGEGPVVGALLAIWVMRDYDVDEQRARRAELDRRRGLGPGEHP